MLVETSLWQFTSRSCADKPLEANSSKDCSSTESENATISDRPPASPPHDACNQTPGLVRRTAESAERPRLINAGSSVASSTPLPKQSNPQGTNAPTAAPFTLARAAQAAGVWNPRGSAAGLRPLPSLVSGTHGLGAHRASADGAPAATTASPMVMPFLGSGDAGQALRNGAVATGNADIGVQDGLSPDPPSAPGPVSAAAPSSSEPPGHGPPGSAAELRPLATEEPARDAHPGSGRPGAWDGRSAAASATVADVPAPQCDQPAAPSGGGADGRNGAVAGRAGGSAEQDRGSPASEADAAGGRPAHLPGGLAVDGSAYISVEDAAELRAALEGCAAVPEAEKALQLEPGGASAVIEKCASGTLQVADLMQLVRLPHRRCCPFLLHA